MYRNKDVATYEDIIFGFEVMDGLRAFYLENSDVLRTEDSFEDNYSNRPWSLQLEGMQQRKIIKNVYNESKQVAVLTEDLVRDIRKKNELFIYSSKEMKSEIPKPALQLSSCFGSFPKIIATFKRFKIRCPTRIQMQLWPCLLSGQNVIAVAPNASGKTLGYILPALVHVYFQKRNCRFASDAPIAMIITHSAILAQQIYDMLICYCDQETRTICITDGDKKWKQSHGIAHGVDIVVATVERLEWLISRDLLDVTNVSFVVFDEADHLVEMSFRSHISFILSRMRSDRQMCMIMSTFSSDIRKRVDILIKEPVLVYQKTLKLVTRPNVDHVVKFFMNEEEKFTWLMAILMLFYGEKILIFTNSVDECVLLQSKLMNFHINSYVYHETIHHIEFSVVKHCLAHNEGRLLITTDISARGIHLPNVSYVINYSVPNNEVMYIQRAGRAGRNSSRNLVMTLVSSLHQSTAQMLLPLIMESSGQEPLFGLRTVALHGYNVNYEAQNVYNADSMQQDNLDKLFGSRSL